MTTFTLTPLCALINANQRLHHHKRAELTRTWRQLTHASATIGRRVDHYDMARIVISYRFPDNRRREVSNLQPTSKAIVDGLVDAGFIDDDDDLHVIGPDNRREWPNGPARVVITITEYAQEAS